MTFEEWWKDCMGWTEYEPDQKEKALAKAAWEAAFDDGYKRGREHNDTDLEVIRNAGIQEGIERMQKAYQIRPRGKSIVSSCPECGLLAYKHKLDCSYGR